MLKVKEEEEKEEEDEDLWRYLTVADYVSADEGEDTKGLEKRGGECREEGNNEAGPVEKQEMESKKRSR